MPSVFVDSTTMIYALDTAAPNKQRRAAAWLSLLLDSNRLILSPQVLTETYWAVVRKPEFEDLRSTIRTRLARYHRWVTAPLDADVLVHGWWIETRYQLRFWDALLLASANAARCDYFLSEDLNDGQTYDRSTVVNPFRHEPQVVLGPA